MIARVTSRGAERWVRGHPWIYRTEVLEGPEAPGLVAVKDHRGRFIGQALYSPASEIRLRLLERTERPIECRPALPTSSPSTSATTM